MVSVNRIAGAKIFADDVAAPRLLFRPGNPVDDRAASLVLSTELVRAGFIWFLKSATAAGQLTNVFAELEGLARRQDADPDKPLARILFGVAEDGAWAAVSSTRAGAAGGFAP